MNQSFYVVDMPTQDMIKDQLPIEDIVAVTKFQTSIVCGSSIESLTLVDIDQEVEGLAIISMMYVLAVVNGETFKIIFSTDNDDLVKAVLTFASKEQSNSMVMEYIRAMLQ